MTTPRITFTQAEVEAFEEDVRAVAELFEPHPLAIDEPSYEKHMSNDAGWDDSRAAAFLLWRYIRTGTIFDQV